MRTQPIGVISQKPYLISFVAISDKNESHITFQKLNDGVLRVKLWKAVCQVAELGFIEVDGEANNRSNAHSPCLIVFLSSRLRS